MKTVSILQYDRDQHQFYPSFVIQDDHQDNDNECAFDELIIQPSQEWMDDYLQWNRFGRLPEDPTEDFLDEEDDPTSFSIPIFESVRDLHDFNSRGQDLTRRLGEELARSGAAACAIRVAPYRPLYSNIRVGPVAAWWHVKDFNYGFVIPVQRLPISNRLKARLQAFRCHKGIEFWQSDDESDDEDCRLQHLGEERNELQEDLIRELCQYDDTAVAEKGKKAKGEKCCATEKTKAVNRVDSLASLGALVAESCSLVVAVSPPVERGSWFPCTQSQRVA
ncbi:expressed unknown protein [Seminavis robusta]|uniref:Uncharacterized protein n=1 Tax=Seminavis robusta TaxID=568900 RepID=A0A9N8DN26_9STRA|nr:expressed unknown protein [Seminavis robusta]|eukprot:Sro217_g089900.1 n/a (278) ;mRNA; f:81030-81863